MWAVGFGATRIAASMTCGIEIGGVVTAAVSSAVRHSVPWSSQSPVGVPNSVGRE